MAWDPAGARLATGCDDKFARVFDRETGQELQKFAHGSAVVGVAGSPRCAGR